MISQNAVKRFHPVSFLPILPISSSKSSLLPSIPKIFNKRLFRMFEMYEGAHFLSLAISKGFRCTRIIRQTSYSKSLKECSSFPNI